MKLRIGDVIQGTNGYFKSSAYSIILCTKQTNKNDGNRHPDCVHQIVIVRTLSIILLSCKKSSYLDQSRYNDI
jgi:hypothetical protein